MTQTASRTILQGDWIEQLKTLPDGCAQCCVTSPPYWGLRDYGVTGQLGLEKTPDAYVAKLVEGFREVGRVLRDDGTIWVNLGDSYNAAGRDGHGTRTGFKQGTNRASANGTDHNRPSADGLKPKDLVGIPWMVAFALRADGWYLRSDIIWAKPNPMPESVTDRPTKAHEYIFLLTKSQKYFYDYEAIKEPVNGGAHRRSGNKERSYEGRLNHKAAGIPWPPPKANGKNSRMVKERAAGREDSKPNPSRSHVPGVGPKASPAGNGVKYNDSFSAAIVDLVPDRNKRSVWTVATSPYRDAHFATFPPDLIKPCILAGTKPGDTGLDPFAGSGTTGQVALELGRKAVLIELNPEYCRMIAERTNVTPGLPL